MNIIWKLVVFSIIWTSCDSSNSTEIGSPTNSSEEPKFEKNDVIELHYLDERIGFYNPSKNDTLFRLRSAEQSQKDSSIVDGHYIIYYDRAYTKRTYEFDVINGWKAGKHTYWYRSGQKKFEGHIHDRLDTGFYHTWHKNGRKDMTRYYERDSLNETIKHFYPTGELKSIWKYCQIPPFTNDQYSEVEYYKNGQRKSEIIFDKREYDSSYDPILKIYWDSLGFYEKAIKYDYMIVPDRDGYGYWDSIVRKNIEFKFRDGYGSWDSILRKSNEFKYK
ncbi:MAG: hypothetical protein JXQ87_17860 [Bacteroidia bacterium]